MSDARSKVIALMEQKLRQGDWMAVLGLASTHREGYGNEPSFHHILGLAQVMKGDDQAGLSSIEQALELAPEAHVLLLDRARLLRRLKRYDDAVDAFRRVVEVQQGGQETLNELGTLLFEINRFDEAREVFEQAAAAQDAGHRTFTRLALLCFNMGDYPAAERAYDKALALEPGDVLARYNHATVYRLLGQTSKARDLLEDGIRRFPREAIQYASMASYLNTMGNKEEAEVYARKALEIDRENPGAREVLSSVLMSTNRVQETLQLLEHNRVTALHFDAYGRALSSSGNQTLASEQFELAVSRGYLKAASNYLMCINYIDGLEPDFIYRMHLKYARTIAAASPVLGRSVIRGSRGDSRIRVGYVSPDFRQHSVGYFILPLLQAHDRSRFETFCYSDYAKRDAITEKVIASCDHFREVVGLSDQAVFQQVLRDGIDILVDLAGHTGNNRLSLFVSKAAPVQVSYLGYPNTTGLDEIGYRFTDDLADPEATSESLYSEKLLRLEGGFLCYQPPEEAPAPRRLDAAATGDRVTFGSFNNPSKISNACVKLWVRVLDAVPNAHLLLKSQTFGDAWVVGCFRERFVAEGGDPQRIAFSGGQATTEEHLARYGEIDIALDTYPYSGTTTTFEALWMGVPVVTLAGDVHASLVSASILKRLGLGELVADTEEGYVELAARLAMERGRLATYHAELRERLRASPLMDAQRLAREIESHYVSMLDGLESQVA